MSKSFEVTHFKVLGKPIRSLCSNGLNLSSKGLENVATGDREMNKNCILVTKLTFEASLPRNPYEHPHVPYSA